MRRDNVSGWSQGHRRCEHRRRRADRREQYSQKMSVGEFCQQFVKHGRGLVLKSNAIIFFIIATPTPIQQMAITEIMRPWLVVHNNET